MWIKVVDFKLGDEMWKVKLFFFVPSSSHVDLFTFHSSLPSLKFIIFIHLLLITVTSTVLILAVYRMPVTSVELS